MTNSREFNAGSVDEALQKAATTLDLPVDDLAYEVLDAGSEGFLGIGARDARIAVQVSDSEAVAVEDPAVEDPAVEDPVVEAEDTQFEAPLEDVDEPYIEQAPDEAGPDLSEIYGDSGDAAEVEAPEELLGEVRELVTSVLDAMGFEARIDVYDADGFVAVDVASDSTALFIGQKGETIDALQYLVNAAIYRKREFVKRIVLDAEGYRQRRVEAIQGIAHRTARRAVRERRPVELPPMSPAERRIVHIYLRDNPSVTTASEGVGTNRRVRVSPA